MAQILTAGDTEKAFRPEADFMVTAHGTLNAEVRIFCMPLSIYNDAAINDKSPFWTELDENEYISEDDGKTLQFRFGSGYICQAKAASELAGNASVHWEHITSVDAASALTPAPAP